MRRNGLFICIVCFVTSLAACTPSSSEHTSTISATPNEYTQAYEALTDAIHDSLVSLALLDTSSFTSQLLKVGYISKDNVVIGIYNDGGTVVGWKIDTDAIVFTHELGIVTSKALVLISSGEQLIGATERTFKLDELNNNIEYVNGVALWDVRTGALVRCITYPCQKNTSPRDGFLGVAVDSSGKRMATFSESGIGFSDVLGVSPSLYLEPVAIDSSYHWRIGSVAFDKQNRRYAVVFQEGRIYIYEEKSLKYRVLVRGAKGDRLPITDAQFDSAGRWLAIARGEKIQLINLDSGRVVLQVNASNPVLAFDQTGELMFVGSSNKIVIYSVKKGLKVSEYDAFGITSLAISEDNRLLIWGDVQGRIHVWGKPLSQP